LQQLRARCIGKSTFAPHLAAHAPLLAPLRSARQWDGAIPSSWRAARICYTGHESDLCFWRAGVTLARRAEKREVALLALRALAREGGESAATAPDGTRPIRRADKMQDFGAAGLTGLEGDRKAGQDVRTQNVMACMAIANIVKTSLGPVGLDKMLVDDIGDTTVTNDGMECSRHPVSVYCEPPVSAPPSHPSVRNWQVRLS
jgi:hypothetical protein